MLKYKVQKCNNFFLKKAKNFFDYKIKNMSDESIASRYLVIKLMEASNYHNISFLETLPSGAPKPISNLYWSISHKIVSKEIYIGVVISSEPIGIDIEYKKPRSCELLNFFSDKEYAILGDKNWLNFYKIWTAKEALIKKLNLELSQIKTIKFLNANYIQYLNLSYPIITKDETNIIYTIV